MQYLYNQEKKLQFFLASKESSLRILFYFMLVVEIFLIMHDQHQLRQFFLRTKTWKKTTIN